MGYGLKGKTMGKIMFISMASGHICVNGRDFYGKHFHITDQQVIADGVRQDFELVGVVKVVPHGSVELILMEDKSSETHSMPNHEHVFGKVYRVNNQNGFNNALYAALGCAEVNGTACHYTKKELRDSVQDFPKKYPALVEFDDKMLECKRVYVSISYDANGLDGV